VLLCFFLMPNIKSRGSGLRVALRALRANERERRTKKEGENESRSKIDWKQSYHPSDPTHI